MSTIVRNNMPPIVNAVDVLVYIRIIEINTLSHYHLPVSTDSKHISSVWDIKRACVILTLHTYKHPLCCGVGKIESLENTMFPCMVCLL